MTLNQKVKKAGLWQSLEIIVLVISQFLYIGVMARFLNKADFGLMAIASSFIGFGAIFSEGGMGPALIQRKEVTNKHKNAALQAGFGIGVVLFVAFFFLAPAIADFFNQPSLKSIIRVIGVNVFFVSASSISLGLLHRNYMFKTSSIITIISLITGYVSGVIGAVNGMGVWSLVLATLVMTGIKTAGYLTFAPVKLSFKLYTKEWKELFSFGFGVILLKILNFFNMQGLNLVLGKIFTPAVLGLFERSNKIKNLPSTHLGNILDKILFPAMSQLQDQTEKLIKTFKNSLGIANSLLWPLSIFLIVFTKEIILILLGDQWLDAVIPLQIMFAVLPFSISNRLGDALIRSTGHIYKNVWRKVIYVIFLLTIVSLGGIHYGIIGAAVAVTTSFMFNYVMTIFLIKHIFKVNIKKIFMHPLLVGLLIALALSLLIIPSRLLINQYFANTILPFFVLCFIIATAVTLILLKKPGILGQYAVYFTTQIKRRE